MTPWPPESQAEAWAQARQGEGLGSGASRIGVGKRVRQQGAVIADAFGQFDQPHALALQAEGQPCRMRARDDAAQFIGDGAGH